MQSSQDSCEETRKRKLMKLLGVANGDTEDDPTSFFSLTKQLYSFSDKPEPENGCVNKPGSGNEEMSTHMKETLKLWKQGCTKPVLTTKGGKYISIPYDQNASSGTEANQGQ